MRTTILLVIALNGWEFAPAQATSRSEARADEPVILGKQLFSDPSLSDNGKVSCATCHDPNRFFADGRADSRGILDIGIGRNSPTMVGVGLLAKFRDPAQAQNARAGRRPKVLSLEQRCLAPLENGLEMGNSIKVAVDSLKQKPEMRERFNRAFGGSAGVTTDRLGKALAAFVASLEPPAESPYRRYLAGHQEALDAPARRGLLVFQGRGRCDACHTGMAMSDGLMHVVDPPRGQRIRDREREAMQRHVELLRREYRKKSPEELANKSLEDLANEAQHKADKLPGGGGYDPAQLEVQTTGLWGVSHTGPYFRDGSVKDLATAVRVHIDEMRQVASMEDTVKDSLRKVDRQGKRSATELRPTGKTRRTPEDLSPEELNDLVQFLRSLSP